MKNKKGTWATIAGVGIFLLSKLKFLAVLLQVAKLKTLITMFISIAAYSFLYGWKFAVVLVYLLLIHEMGHMYAAKRKGVPTTGAIFIPFLGAAIGIKERPKSLKDDIYISIMGPVAGLLSIMPFFMLYFTTGEQFWIDMFRVGAFLNLFNMLPMLPFDGGRIARGISQKLWGVGMAVFLALAVISPDPIIIIILIFGVLHLFGYMSEQREWKEKAVYKEEFETGLAKWDMLVKEWEALDSAERVAWLNIRMMEEERQYFAYEQEKEMVSRQGKGKKWTADKAQYKRLEGKAHVQRHILSGLHTLYDQAPEPLYKLQDELKKVAEAVEKKEAYERLTKKERFIIFLQYIGLCFVLSGCIAWTIITSGI